MQFALLGDIQFELLAYFEGMEWHYATDYAEHARIEGKPRLQFIGDKLDELKLSTRFHTFYCEPEVEIQRLREAQLSHAAMPFVLGTGEFKGDFVITEFSVTPEFTDYQGALVSATASLSLKESIVVLDVSALGEAVKKIGDKLPAGAKSKLGDLAKPNVLLGQIKSAVATGRNIMNTVRQVGNVIRIVKAMSKSPQAAISQLGALAPALGGLSSSAEKLGLSTTALTALVKEAAPVAKMASRVGTEALGMSRVIAGGITLDNLASKAVLIEGSVSACDKAITTARPALASMAARVATRSAQ